MAEQILTVDVDWASKSGSSDSTIAFGEQFTLNIKGMKTESLAQDKHSLRVMLLTQSVPEDDNVVWQNGSSKFTVAEDGTVIVEGLKVNTQAVLDALNQQGGKSRLYLAVTEMDDGAPFTDYGTSRLTVSLGSFIEDPSYDPPETVDTPKFSDIKNLFNQVSAGVDAISGVETRVNAAKEAVEADKVAVATLAGQAQTAASTATSAANSAGLSVNSANALASRAEEAKRIAVNASENVSNMQDEIGATKTKIDATAKVVQSNADAVADAKKDIDTAIATASTAITEAVGKAETAKTDAVKAQVEASKSAEQAATSASNASTDATSAKTSEQNAKQTADALNAGLATLNSFDGRVTAIEDGEGVYKDSKGQISTFTPLSVGGGNFKVMSYCLPLTKASPVDLEFAENSQGSLCSNGTHCFAADYLMTTRSANIRIYDANLNLLTSLIDTAGGNVAAGYKHATFEACFAIVDGYIYYAKLDRKTICKYDMSGELQTSAIVTAKAADKLRIFYNNITGHICVLKEDSYVPSGNRNCYIHVFDTDLNPIKNSDGTNKVIDISYTVSDNFGSHLGRSFACMKMWYVRGRVYICVPFGYGGDTKYSNVYLYTATEDDSIEPVRESIPVKDDNGFVVFETDSDGNPIVDDQTLEGAGVFRPKTTQGEILVFNSAVDSSRGTAYRCNPIFGKGRTSLGDAGQIYCMTDGVDAYMITSDGRFVDLYRMQNWNAKDKTVLPVKYRDKRTGLTEKNAPNSNCSLYCIGAPAAIWGTTPLLCGLIWDSNGTIFGKDTRVVPMAVIDDKPRVAEYNTLTGAPIAFPGSLAGGAQNCAPIGAKWGFARYWFTTADAAVRGNV